MISIINLSQKLFFSLFKKENYVLLLNGMMGEVKEIMMSLAFQLNMTFRKTLMHCCSRG